MRDLPWRLVLDTNVVLDLLLFREATAQPIEDAIERRRARCYASQHTLTEFSRVLTYPAFQLDAPAQAALLGRYQLWVGEVQAVTESKGTVMHSAVTGVGSNAEQQREVCKVIRFLAEKGAPLDERNATGRTPIDVADFLPLDQAVDLLTELIIKSGAKPKTPTKR